MRVPEELRRERVDKTKFRIYLQKAEEFLSAAKDEFESSRYNSAASSAAHAAINALDAMTVYLSGYRHAGQRHEDAWKLLISMLRGYQTKVPLRANLSPLSASNRSRSMKKDRPERARPYEH